MFSLMGHRFCGPSALPAMRDRVSFEVDWLAGNFLYTTHVQQDWQLVPHWGIAAFQNRGTIDRGGVGSKRGEGRGWLGLAKKNQETLTSEMV